MSNLQKKPLFNPDGDIDLRLRRMIGGNTTNLNDYNNLKYAWMSVFCCLNKSARQLRKTFSKKIMKKFKKVLTNACGLSIITLVMLSNTKHHKIFPDSSAGRTPDC